MINNDERYVVILGSWYAGRSAILEMLVVEEGGKPEYSERNLLEKLGENHQQTPLKPHDVDAEFWTRCGLRL